MMDTVATRRRRWVLRVLLGLAATVTAAAGLKGFSMDGEVLGHVGLRAQLENVHLATARSSGMLEIQAMPGLRSLHVELNSRTFLSTYILPLIVNLLPDEDPDGAFQAARSKVVTAIQALLSASALSVDTTQPVLDLVADFPHPKQPAVLDIAANTPITPDVVGAAIDDAARVAALLRTLTATAGYVGAFQ